MNRKFGIILVAILIMGFFPVAMKSIYTTNINPSLADKLMTVIKTTEVSAKINDYDPSFGSLTGRFFPGNSTGGFLNNTDSDTDYDQLLLDVEVNITQSDEYYVIVIMVDYSLSYQHPDGYYEDKIEILGFSSSKTLSTGIQYVTAIFNCTEMRAMKLAGPYNVIASELVHVPSMNWVDHIPSTDNWYSDKPLFKISMQDIYTFDQPRDTNDLTFHDSVLVNGNLEVNFIFTSFSHANENTEPYYFHLALKNGTGTTIVNYEEIIDIDSNTENTITLKIPSEYINAFEQHIGFLSDSPTLLFQEIAVVQFYGVRFNGDYWMNRMNMSYSSNANLNYSTIKISETSSIDVLGSGDTHDFGAMDVYDSAQFIVYSELTRGILELQITRTFPQDSWPSEFHTVITNGWGRTYDDDYHNPRSPFIVYNEQWNNYEDIQYIYTLMGIYPGPWYFYIEYPDWNGPTQPTQDLSVGVDIFEDTTEPTITLNQPVDSSSYNQYYGIPFEGTTFDDSMVTKCELIYEEEVVYVYNPFENMGGWGSPSMEGFEFVWFPSHNITTDEPIDVTLRVYDLGHNTQEITRSLTIVSGNKPIPKTTINEGLEWLRSKQNSDGSWDYYDGPSDGMTALAALCFIQAGLASDQVVIDAINYLINGFEDDHDTNIPGKVIQRSGHMTYETAMAAIALIAFNATLLTYDTHLSTLIDEVIEWLVYTQNDETWGVNPNEPWYGGWRYGYDHHSSDLSVSQWVILALAAYKYEDPLLWGKVQTFVERCRGGYWDSTGSFIPDGGFTYTPSSQDWRNMGGGSYGSMTGAGIWGLFLSGLSPDNSYIVAALDWIGSHRPEEIVGQNPETGRTEFEYYWYLCASKAFLMAGREQDQWWYDLITEYLNTHMIADSSTSAYWDNSLGQEPPIFATVQAILSQQVLYGDVPMDTLEVSLEAKDGSVLYLWNSTLGVGFNYSTGLEESSSEASYYGILSDKQKISIKSPSKGEYFVDVFPDAGENGMRVSQELVLRARAITDSGHIISYKTEDIKYQYSMSYPQVLRYRLVLSTISGLDIHILPVNPPMFPYTVSIDSVGIPSTSIELGDEYDVNVTLTNRGSGTISSGSVYAKTDDSAKQSKSFTNWAQENQQTFSFHYTTTELLAGIRVTVIYLVADNTNPLVVRLEVPIGNQAPDGYIEAIPSPISGTYISKWNVTDADGDTLTYTVVLVYPDGSEDTLATDISGTSYSFDSTTYPDGTGYKLVVEASDGIDTTHLASELFDIENSDTTLDQLSPGFGFILALLALSSSIIWYRKKRY